MNFFVFRPTAKKRVYKIVHTESQTSLIRSNVWGACVLIKKYNNKRHEKEYRLLKYSIC